jgi:hypothetical protein
VESTSHKVMLTYLWNYVCIRHRYTRNTQPNIPKSAKHILSNPPKSVHIASTPNPRRAKTYSHAINTHSHHPDAAA